MSAVILDGKALAAQLREEIAGGVDQLKSESGVVPTLAAVLVGDDPASQIYVRNKSRACAQVGIDSQVHRLPPTTSQQDLLQLFDQLNGDDSVHAILVQLPLPGQIDTSMVLDAVDPQKDVDAFHPHNVGLLVQGRPRFLPCTPHGIQQLLHRSGVAVAGKHVVVAGRSDIVGKPMALMLAQRNSTLGPTAANATVTICHSRTSDLGAITRQADVLIAAIGQAAMITGDMVKPGAAVVDVGINRTEQGLVGDVDFASVRQVAGYLTPVPGGVGPLTIAMLLHNTLQAARRSCSGQS